MPGDTNKLQNFTPVRMALLGASRIAARVVPRIKASPLVDVHGVAATDAIRAQQFMHQHALKVAYSSYEECLEDASVEAIYISTLNKDHAATIKLALEADKHVLCEKPLVLTEKDAAEIYGLADRKNRIVLEGYMYRFFSQVQRALEILKSGQLGSVLSVRANYAWILYDLELNARRTRATQSAGGGALHDIGSYCVDFINWVLPDIEPETIQGFARVWDGIDLSTVAILKYAGGITAILDCAIDRPGFNAFEIVGTRGVVTVPRFDWKAGDELPVYVIDEDGCPRHETVLAHDAFLPEFEHFALAVRGKCTPHISPRASIKNARMLEAIRGHMLREEITR